jgi:uncharacterized protein (DUF433 family)
MFTDGPNATSWSSATKFDRITVDPALMQGRPCVRGMRITVSLVVNLVANGLTAEQIVREYPDLETEDVRQCLQYAAWLAEDRVMPFKDPSVAVSG